MPLVGDSIVSFLSSWSWLKETVCVGLTHGLSPIDSGYLGASGCMILSSWGAAWGTWRAGMGVCQMGVDHPKGVIKNIVPIVMAGVLGIYGLIVSVIITQSISSPGSDGYNTYSVYNGYTHVSRRSAIFNAVTVLYNGFLNPSHSFPTFVPTPARRRAMLWVVMFGSWRHHWCHRRCWSESVWCQGRTRAEVVLGQFRGGWRRRLGIWRCQCGGSLQQTLCRNAYYAHFLRSFGAVVSTSTNECDSRAFLFHGSLSHRTVSLW